jgi:hypothetical protein
LATIGREDADAALATYVDRFVGQMDVKTEALWRMLQLTAVVSAEGEPELDPFATGATREEEQVLSTRSSEVDH